MSSIKRDKITKKILQDEHVDPARKQQALQTALYTIGKEYPFFGMILQCLDIFYTHQMPSAGIFFENNAKKWQMAINPKWFCDKLNDGNREAILLHELYHLTHKHVTRAPLIKINPARRILMNIAMDMAINQYIKNLPNGCKECPPLEEQMHGARCQNEMCPGRGIFVEDYYDFDAKGAKVPWEKNKSFEYYYHKLIEKFKQMSDSNSGDGEGEGGSGSPNGQGDGLPQEFDSHNWDSNSEESEMMDATEELVKRAMQKRGLTYDKLPGFMQELLQDIEARRSELNYRQLILSAIKKHASGFDRKNTWTRPSKRFGNLAPGTKVGELPKLANYIDSSGSISIQEANDFLEIIDNFLKVGARKCNLGLWHTNLYYFEQYKLGDRLDKEVFSSGGTDVACVLKHVAEQKPDLTIILTDGCYDDVRFEEMISPTETFPQVLWIISQDGNEHHPLRRLGETIKIPRTQALKRDSDLEN